MASPTFARSLIEPAESSTAAAILRNDDALSQALRDGTTLNIDDIARLNHRPLAPGDVSSVGTSSTKIFSSREGSVGTKPTSTGTDHATVSRLNKGKGKIKARYSSSLSGTHGSASEAEVELQVVRRNTLLAMGDWADNELGSAQPLRGAARAKERQQIRRPPRRKKPLVIIEQREHACGRVDDRVEPVVAHEAAGKRTNTRYLRQRTTKYNADPVRLAEEGQSRSVAQHSIPAKPLPRTRLYAIATLVSAMLLTVVLSAFGAHTTGKARMSSTKVIVFIATALLSCLTVLAMLIARRAPSEALLAGLLEFSFGFALLIELDDFM